MLCSRGNTMESLHKISLRQCLCSELSHYLFCICCRDEHSAFTNTDACCSCPEKVRHEEPNVHDVQEDRSFLERSCSFQQLQLGPCYLFGLVFCNCYDLFLLFSPPPQSGGSSHHVFLLNPVTPTGRQRVLPVDQGHNIGRLSFVHCFNQSIKQARQELVGLMQAVL